AGVTVLARKLAKLKQQAGEPLPAAPARRIAEARAANWPPAPTAAERHARQIAQLRKLMGLRPASTRPQVPSRDRTLDGEEIAPGLGRIAIRQPAPPPAPVLDLSELRHEPVAASRSLAFDTETTGLAGGTGTRAFMIGAADWHDGSLRIRQLLMTTLGAERAMLAEFARWLADDTVLLSYNGKSYDRPLL